MIGDRVRDPDTGEEWVRGPGGLLHRPCPPDCIGGYRFVTDLYAASIADPQTDLTKYRAALNSVYPCPNCNPDQHRLWEAGHSRPEHLTSGGCEECRPSKAGRR